MNVLIDTNVILDFLLSREPLHEAGTNIFELTYQEQIHAYTTASSITDIYYIVVKRLGDNAAREVLRNLFNLITVITVDGEDCILALNLPISDFEDALLTTCSKKAGVEYIVTNDEVFLNADGSLARVISAIDFLKLINVQ